MTADPSAPTARPLADIAFVGGGNMAAAILGGLLAAGRDPATVTVVEPFEATAASLRERFGVRVLPAADASLARAALGGWAGRPQVFAEAARPWAAHRPAIAA